MGYNQLESLVNNTQAIATVFNIWKDGRTATQEEQTLLRKYTGFGGHHNVLLLDCDRKQPGVTGTERNFIKRG